jgi:hypothetical protein
MYGKYMVFCPFSQTSKILLIVQSIQTNVETDCTVRTTWVFWRAETTTLGKIFQEEYFSHFLAKPGAERAQTGVFGHSGAIGAIYFAL